MPLILRTFATEPRLRDKRYGDGREYTQRAQLLDLGGNQFGNVFEFRFDESAGHLPLGATVPLNIDSFTILREKKKMANGGDYDRFYLGLDPSADFVVDKNVKPAQLAVTPWSDEVDQITYDGGRIVYRQQCQLVDRDTLDGFPFELTSSDRDDCLKAGQFYGLRAGNFAAAAYGGIRIDTKTKFAALPGSPKAA